MAADEEKKDKEKAQDGKKEKEKVEEVITAVFKVNLHCQQCARDIKKPLNGIQGVHTVDADFEKGELKVKGVIDPLKIQKRLEKLSKKKVELVSPKVKIKETPVKVETKVKETKELIVRTTTVKAHMHCGKCEQDLKKRLLMHKGVYNVKTDMKAQTLTVGGTIEPEKLLSYLKKKVNKPAEIISSKAEKKEEEKKEKDKKGEGKPAEKPAEKGEGKPAEKSAEKSEGKPAEKPAEKPVEKGESKPAEKPAEKPVEKGEGKPTEKSVAEKGEGKPTEKVDGKPSESTKTMIEVKEDIKIVEVKTRDSNSPYFIHYVYAPQLFSDENPNACSVM